MGRRSEPRIDISLPVVVRGSDSQGKPFSVNAETHDISASGASLCGLNDLLAPGNKIEIEFRDQSAWFRVQWVGSNGSSRAGRVGVRCMERKYIWNLPAAPWEADNYGDASPFADSGLRTPARWNGVERRSFPRRTCRIETQVWTADSSLRVPGKISDLSLNGCYVEMLSPFPIHTDVELELTLDSAQLHLSGKVCTSQTGMGMGVAFTGMTAAEFEQLRVFAPPPDTHSPAAKIPPQSLPSRTQPSHQAQPQPAGSPRPDGVSRAAPAPAEPARPTTDEAVETLLRVLLRRGIVTRDELSAEFAKLKSSKT